MQNFVCINGVQSNEITPKVIKLQQSKSCFRTKGSNSIPIGDHYNKMGYGTFPTSQLTLSLTLHERTFLELSEKQNKP